MTLGKAQRQALAEAVDLRQGRLINRTHARTIHQYAEGVKEAHLLE